MGFRGRCVYARRALRLTGSGPTRTLRFVSAISPELRRKSEQLEESLHAAGRLLVAYSGGVDSSFLAWAAHRATAGASLAVTALSASYPRSHREMAERVAHEFGIPHRCVDTAEMDDPAYRANRPDRCYHCKSELFRVLGGLREELGFDAVAYGVNTDDTGDFRPGHRAADERGVLSPFLDAGLSKAEIRELSRRAGLPTAELPASACLSSRLPYGTEVTPERLQQVERGEEALRGLGFRQVRLRHHGDVARIEVEPAELARALDPQMARRMSEAVRPLGFRWVALDLDGYRTGSLNEVLSIRSEPSER